MIKQMKMQMMRIMQRMPGMISCAEFDAFICDYLDGQLADKPRRIFERHLHMCKDCQAYLERYRTVIELQRRVLATPDASLPGEVPEDLIKAVMAARDAEA